MFRHFILVLCLSIFNFFVFQPISNPANASDLEASAIQFHSRTIVIASESISSPSFSHLVSFGQPCPGGRSTTSLFSMMACYWPTNMGTLLPVDIPEKYKTVFSPKQFQSFLARDTDWSALVPDRCFNQAETTIRVFQARIN